MNYLNKLGAALASFIFLVLLTLFMFPYVFIMNVVSEIRGKYV